MTQENKKDDKLVVVESRWDFLKQRTPDFLEDSMAKVVKFIAGLPFLTDEQKQEFLEKIKSLRERKGRED